MIIVSLKVYTVEHIARIKYIHNNLDKCIKIHKLIMPVHEPTYLSNNIKGFFLKKASTIAMSNK